MANLEAAGTAVTPEVAIRVAGVEVAFGETPVLRGVCFNLAPGRVLGILGPNGAGKTTLLKVLATLVRPTAGEAYVLGYDVRRSAAVLRRRVGYLGHQLFLYPELSGWENLWFWSRAYGVRDPRRRIPELLDLVGLEPFAHDPVRHYSRGMQQRLTLARALVHDPLVLLLDEPVTGLDVQAAALLDRVVRQWADRGRTVVLTSHDPARALAECDDLLVLRRGRAVLDAPARDLTLRRLDEAVTGEAGAARKDGAGRG